MLARAYPINLPPPVQVTFAVYPQGFEHPYSRRSHDLLRHEGLAIRWIRRRLRMAQRDLGEAEKAALAKWLQSTEKVMEARRAIVSKKGFEYVVASGEMRIRATGRRISLHQ